MIRRWSYKDQGFEKAFAGLFEEAQSVQGDVHREVSEILTMVRKQGDQALLQYVRRFDGMTANSVDNLCVPKEVLAQAWQDLDKRGKEALQVAHDNVFEYGERQKIMPWSYTREDGSVLAQQVSPLDSVGIYVPGGKAAYPSSVIMNAVPAKVAGVPRIVMACPASGGALNPLVLASAYLCGVDEVWQMGGAHAIAALAYGTESIAAVDKITGPGNRYVAEAKRLVFGQVGIDMVAGPSEVVVIADDSVSPEWAAADLFAQAEHDELAQSILLTPSASFAEAVYEAMLRLLPEMPRREIIRASLAKRGVLIVAEDLAHCISLANALAPEHLELMCEGAEALVSKVRHAGAIFVGAFSNEVFGDYCAGSNHVLPTARSARFSSGLGVYDFQKRSSVLQLSKNAAQRLSAVADYLAQGEGLFAHALSARLRGEKDDV